MTLNTEIEAANTREKLRELEDRYEARRQETPADARVHELTLQSLRRLINQLKEELARYEARRAAPRTTTRP